MNVSKYKDLNDFLSKHKPVNKENITHTRIGDSTLNIYGGCYSIQEDELPLFYELYYDAVFIKKKLEYLTEKQLSEKSPILIDLDFRYDYSVDKKQHTKDHVDDLIFAYLDVIKEFFVFEENKSFPIFVMEKREVNRLADGSLTKDGIHIIIGIQMNHTMQQMLREKMVVRLPEIWGTELPFINEWDNILDEGISKGCVNWQMYGSRKPDHLAYELTTYYEMTMDATDGEFMTEDKTKSFNLSKQFQLLSAQYSNHVAFEINPKIKAVYEKRLSGGITNVKKKLKKVVSKANVEEAKADDDDDDDDDEEYVPNKNIDKIINAETLASAVNKMLKHLQPNSEYTIREIHEYTQILPEKYYKPGSHVLNTQVAFALKHTDERLFISWVLLRSKASDFEYSSIPELYKRWKKMVVKEDGITKKSIIYWAKQDAYNEYMNVRKNTISHYIDITIATQTDFDFANVLYHMFKDKFLCSSIKSTEWYVFEKHRWEKDLGSKLRLSMSTEVHKFYHYKLDLLLNEMQSTSQDDMKYQQLKHKIATVTQIMNKLKTTCVKNNIMKEAAEIFYDKNFIKNMDSNKYLLCFSNGVIDFETGVFRDGYPQDYITKSTQHEYIEKLTSKNDIENMKIINTLMCQLFPEPSLCQYMWNHLAATLIGENINQTFNIYLGSGSNGKSILTDLMSKSLGDYKGTVPITLVTSDKRTALGGTSSELIQLKAIRYAVMQEPSKDSKINEGVMKELTGGDPIQARQLYAESEIFTPQFSLVVCTNNLPEISSNDDGTWRRIRVVPFKSKFLDEDDAENWKDPDILYKYPKDKNLKDKLFDYASTFISMLTQIALKTKGNVEDCEIVTSYSKKYRQNQDLIAGFINENIEKKEGAKLTSLNLYEHFKKWLTLQNLTKKIPKKTELEEYMTKKFGKHHGKGVFWNNIDIIEPEDGASLL